MESIFGDIYKGQVKFSGKNKEVQVFLPVDWNITSISRIQNGVVKFKRVVSFYVFCVVYKKLWQSLRG